MQFGSNCWNRTISLFYSLKKYLIKLLYLQDITIIKQKIFKFLKIKYFYLKLFKNIYITRDYIIFTKNILYCNIYIFI